MKLCKDDKRIVDYESQLMNCYEYSRTKGKSEGQTIDEFVVHLLGFNLDDKETFSNSQHQIDWIYFLLGRCPKEHQYKYRKKLTHIMLGVM